MSELKLSPEDYKNQENWYEKHKDANEIRYSTGEYPYLIEAVYYSPIRAMRMVLGAENKPTEGGDE